MTIEFIAKACNTAGTLFIAYAALRVHHRVLTEKQVDNKVLGEMRREQLAGILGMVLVALAFLLEI